MFYIYIYMYIDILVLLCVYYSFKNLLDSECGIVFISNPVETAPMNACF